MDAALLLADLDVAQRAAVTTESTLVAVVAGAGSGKTRVLTRRVAHRIVTESAEAAHTLVLTFTREASAELGRRLPRLGVSARVTAGTFHAIALSLLQQRWRDHEQPALNVDADRGRAIRRLAGGLDDVEAICGEVDWACGRGFDAEAYASAARRGGRPLADSDVVAGVLARYADDKRRRGVLDLDDILTTTIQALEHDAAFADGVRWRFRHLLVDEAQDLNPPQQRLVDLLRFGRDDLFLVGDPAQAIYGFNGSDPALLVDVEQRFPGIEIVRLPANHRCTPQIVAAGAHVLGESSQGAELHSSRDDGAIVLVRSHADDGAEAAQIAERASRLDRSLIGRRGAAVLARTNAQLDVIAAALERRGVPVARSGAIPAATRQTLAHLFRREHHAELRAWAHDALEEHVAEEHVDQPSADDRGVAAVVLDFLRDQPLGTGSALRAWVDANDPFGTARTGVELLTFHAAKGREWHTVMLAGCETSLVHHRSATTTAARQEEARLLYVAITRATDQLEINFAARRGGYQRRLTPWLESFASEAPNAVPPPTGLPRRSPRELTLQRLRQWRATAARAAGVLPEAICSDEVLALIAEQPPGSDAELDALTGIGAITSRRHFPGIAEALAG